MKYPTHKIICSFLGLLIFLPCIVQASFAPVGGYVKEGVVFGRSDIALSAGISASLNNGLLDSKLSPNNIGSGVELFSPVSSKGESVSDISTQYKTDTAPECRKHKCQNGLTDEEWEQGFHMFILCFFVAPLLSTILGVIAGALGWLSWLPWMRD